MILVIDYNLKDIKVSTFEEKFDGQILSSDIKAIDEIKDDDLFKKIIQNINGKKKIKAISFRILFGGDYFDKPTLVDEKFFLHFEKLTDFFPFYVPLTSRMLKRFQKIFKDIPLIAFFETSFFLKLPDKEKYYTLPFEYYQNNRIKRWGFHGIFHQANTRIFSKGDRNLSIVFDKQTTVCATRNNKPLSVSLGYTPLGGIMSRTSCGDLDPGIVLYLMNVHKLSIYEIDEMLKNKSGFVGLSGYDISISEMLKLYGKDAKVDMAFDIYQSQIMKYVGEGIAALGGLDNIIFAGSNVGIFTPIIHQIVRKILFLGINTISLPWSEDKTIIDITSAESRIKVYISRMDIAKVIFHESDIFCKNSSNLRII
ncbi:MAG: hypothetical protein P9M02_03305 [Candidatus Susulua stagnicola]|nr:hypothetical protein [Candidatus Susulua stagnicola]